MSYDIAREDVPEFVKRVGDRVIAGSNNSMIVFGTDRPTDIDSGYGDINSLGGGKRAGSCHIIVGRAGENPDPIDDKSFIYLSMKTDVDDNLELTFEEETNDVAAAVVKSDALRFVARENLKISVGGAYIFMKSDGTVIIDGPKIELGSDATERVIKGETFTRIFAGHAHATATGNSGPPLPNPDLQANRHLSERKVFVK